MNKSVPEDVESLGEGSEKLVSIYNAFVEFLNARDRLPVGDIPPVEIVYFFEALKTEGVGIVVPRNSATLPGFDSSLINADHVKMSRFNRDSAEYSLISGILRRWIKELDEPITAASPKINISGSSYKSVVVGNINQGNFGFQINKSGDFGFSRFGN